MFLTFIQQTAVKYCSTGWLSFKKLMQEKGRQPTVDAKYFPLYRDNMAHMC